MNRQYIGARYVPKFFENPNGGNEWIEGIAYEPLTVVTYLNNSFTSKKPVPAGINILNTEYWVNTGNYNAQVAEYQQQVINLSQSLSQEITNRENSYNSLLNAINDLKNYFPVPVYKANQNIISMEGNTLKYIDLTYTIPPKSILEFEFGLANIGVDANFYLGLSVNETAQQLADLQGTRSITNVRQSERIASDFLLYNGANESFTFYLYVQSSVNTQIQSISINGIQHKLIS